MTTAVDFVVVGLGAMGSAALRDLAARGASVVGLEQHFIGHAFGSSHGGSRVIRKAYAEEPRYVPLVLRSYELWRALEAETRPGLLTITGGLHMGSPAHPSLVSIKSAVRDHGLDCQELDGAQIRERFPAFAPADGHIGLYEPDAGVLAVEPSIAAAVEVAVRHGADVRLETEVVAIEEQGDQVVVRTAAGDRFAASATIVCTGGGFADGQPLDLRVHLEISRQVQLWFQPTAPKLFKNGRFPLFISHTDLGEFYGLADPYRGGVKVCQHYGGASSRLADLDRTVRDSDSAAVRQFLRRHLPAADGPLIGSSVCHYTNSRDRHFVIGRRGRIVFAAGFSGHGFKFAPVIGEILGDLATDGSTRHAIDMFDPNRFTETPP